MPGGMAGSTGKQFGLSDVQLVVLIHYLLHVVFVAGGTVVGGVTGASVAGGAFQRALLAVV